MRTVLCAGSDRAVSEACRRALEDEGYRVILARDTAEAIELWQSERPDVVILDNLIFHHGALEAAEQIALNDPDARMVLYMGYDDTYVRDPRTRFFFACVEKGEDFTELKLAVSRALMSRDQESLFRAGLPPT